MKSNLNKTIFTFFGPPGCGKGTLASKLVERLGFEVLSTGNLCRSHIAQATEFGKLLDEYLKKGAMVPDSLIIDMVTDWLKSKVKQNLPIILDGFPRTQAQADAFLNYLKSDLVDHRFRMILINLSDDEIVKRISMRVVCENKKCQKPFSLLNGNVSVCDSCGSNLSKRADDREEVVRERLKVYAAYCGPLLDFYKNAGQKIEQFEISEKSPEEVYSDFVAML